MTSSPAIIRLPLISGDEIDIFGGRDHGDHRPAMRRNAKRSYARRVRRLPIEIDTADGYDAYAAAIHHAAAVACQQRLEEAMQDADDAALADWLASFD